MKTPTSPILLFVLLLTLTIAILTPYSRAYARSNEHGSIPVSVIGIHHLGPQYFIYRFYINKSIGDNVGERGGGGSEVCCITLPPTWEPNLQVDVRWEVDHIIRGRGPYPQDKAETQGIYQAQVPIEKYSKIGDLYVHFFTNGRVRVVVSPISSDGDAHPVHAGDANASRTASTGKAIKALLTPEEIAEIARQVDQERKLHGDWR